MVWYLQYLFTLFAPHLAIGSCILLDDGTIGHQDIDILTPYRFAAAHYPDLGIAIVNLIGNLAENLAQHIFIVDIRQPVAHLCVLLVRKSCLAQEPVAIGIFLQHLIGLAIVKIKPKVLRALHRLVCKILCGCGQQDRRILLTRRHNNIRSITICFSKMITGFGKTLRN
ncbi:hypothetical protein D3C81_1194640 [compost metagenome]